MIHVQDATAHYSACLELVKTTGEKCLHTLTFDKLNRPQRMLFDADRIVSTDWNEDNTVHSNCVMAHTS